MIENVMIGISPRWKHFRKGNCEMGKDCPFIHSQKEVDLKVKKEKVKANKRK